MPNFCKSEDCPTSEELVAFQIGEMPVRDGGPIRKHLAACDFCAAEVEFYENYPPAPVTDLPEKAVAMPQPLFELAEALLKKKQDDLFFEELIEGTEFPY
ncbi:MAG TPA: hypothetical protein PKD26_03370 [Pyrinomonadaceae bacterium]|mgnify:CR=1 FL=1|nr:hypothetical protein [Pyrinomonadaceae bacterium]